MNSLFDTFDKAYAAEVHVVVLLSQGEVIVDAVRHVALRLAELTRSEEKGQVLVVVKSPDAMRACRLQEICAEEFANDEQVLLEDLVHSGAHV